MTLPTSHCPLWHPACFFHFSHSTAPLDSERLPRSPGREERPAGAQPAEVRFSRAALIQLRQRGGLGQGERKAQ